MKPQIRPNQIQPKARKNKSSQARAKKNPPEKSLNLHCCLQYRQDKTRQAIDKLRGTLGTLPLLLALPRCRLRSHNFQSAVPNRKSVSPAAMASCSTRSDRPSPFFEATSAIQNATVSHKAERDVPHLIVADFLKDFGGWVHLPTLASFVPPFASPGFCGQSRISVS